MTAKWKQIESYYDSKSIHESRFNINKKQAQMILDLKRDELKKMRFLAMLDIDKDEVKQLAKKDPSIVRAIGRQGGSFRTSMVRKRANEEIDMSESRSDVKKFVEFLKKKGFRDVDKFVAQGKKLKLKDEDLTDYIAKELNKLPNPFVSDIKKRFVTGENELEEAIKINYVLVDTSRNDKVIAMSSDEQGVEDSMRTATLPPLKVKNKSSLKIVKLKRPKGDNMAGKLIGEPLKSWGEEVELEEATFSPAMVDKLRKAYGPMKGKKIAPQILMKIFDKFDKNKDALIQLYKADIPFVSTMAMSRLMIKHKMKAPEINKLREDAPTNAVAHGGVDMNPTGLAKKKKKLYDGRTKEYKLHRRNLEAQRDKRIKRLKAQKDTICGSFRENLDIYTVKEDNMDMLRDIVKRKSAQGIKLGDGKKVTVDMQTANAILSAIDKVKPATKPKMMTIVNKGNSRQFLQLVKLVFGK